jgi:hypothetical protein
MTAAVHKKVDIVYEYLQTAMQLYVEEKHYFPAMHLAAAAEELFGRHLPEGGRMSSIALKAQMALPHVLNAGEDLEDDATQARYAAAQDTRVDEYKKRRELS